MVGPNPIENPNAETFLNNNTQICYNSFSWLLGWKVVDMIGPDHCGPVILTNVIAKPPKKCLHLNGGWRWVDLGSLQVRNLLGEIFHIRAHKIWFIEPSCGLGQHLARLSPSAHKNLCLASMSRQTQHKRKTRELILSHPHKITAHYVKRHPNR